ncbi:glycoside hydrolase family 10 protein [Hyella patelloides]|uniref:glycoside hydrolase family 10 protein n=1 Tax=Hyella patelloides TaxID=1982969 RepID=UPI001FE99499|nr:family 10 glycosylhydrolase [Hyella patelloides]
MTIILVKLLIPLPRYQTSQSNNQIQGVWMTHIGTSFLSYVTLLDNAFHQLSRLNFNRVYVDVYNGGVIYPSQYAPRNYKRSLPFTDPLKAAIEAGKSQNLKIYAWYEHGMMMFPDDKLAKEHPDWLLATADGQTFIEKHVWLDPNNPEVAEYFTNLFLEVANNYPDLYGIQLDDHWGIPQVFGNKVDAMNQLTQKVFSAIKKTRPDLIISLSPNPYNFAYNKYSQDWLAWVKQRLVDEVVVQVYRPTTQQVTDSLINAGLNTAQQYVPVAVGIYTGDLYTKKSLTEIKNQISVVENSNYGYALFCWEYLFTPLKRGSLAEKEAIFIEQS